MLPDRVSKLLHAFFNYPLKQYAEVVDEIRDDGGLTHDEVEAIQSQVVNVDARMLVRHAGAAGK
jgi:hypothetical protein